MVAHPSEATMLSIVRTAGDGDIDQALVTGLNLDVIFPVLHGPYGEDGTIQGLLELANVPYVGAGVLASAVGMDKDLMKVVFAARGLPVCAYRLVRRHEWERRRTTSWPATRDALGFPMFVKPANLGSSVGISKAKDRASLIEAIELAGSSTARSSSKRPCRTRARSSAPSSATTSRRRPCRARSSRRGSSTTTRPSTSTRDRR
jgi:D-alanine--D-alanine ligase